MLGIRSVGVCGCHSVNSFVCFGAKPTERASARDERRKVRKNTEGSQQKGAEEISRVQISSQEKDTVRSWESDTEETSQ